MRPTNRLLDLLSNGQNQENGTTGDASAAGVPKGKMEEMLRVVQDALKCGKIVDVDDMECVDREVSHEEFKEICQRHENDKSTDVHPRDMTSEQRKAIQRDLRLVATYHRDQIKGIRDAWRVLELFNIVDGLGQ
jgi:hypothetical protein